MKILVIVDIHGSHEILTKILDSIKEDYDLLICAGDLTDMFNIPPEFSQMDIANLVLQKLLSTNKPLFCIPGNHDPYEILELFNEFDVNLHEKIRAFGGYDFLGFGGARTPFHTIFEPSEEEIKEALDPLTNKTKNNLVAVFHAPPEKTKLDQVYSGQHVGSGVIREFITKNHPILAISGHIHEAMASDTLGKTVLFNPGPAYDGYYGLVEIKAKEAICQSKRIKI